MLSPTQNMSTSDLKVRSIKNICIPDALRHLVEASRCIWAMDSETFESTIIYLEKLIENRDVSAEFILRNIDHAAGHRQKKIIELAKLYKEISMFSNINLKPISKNLENILSAENQNDLQAIDVISTIYPKDSAFYYVANDQLEDFVRISDTKNFNFSMTYPNSRIAFRIKITLLDIACKFGSENCFHYLKLKGCSTSNQTTKYAIVGGNIAIINSLFEEGCNFESELPTAIEFHHNDVVDWMISTYPMISTSVTFCITNFNIELSLFLIENGFDVNMPKVC